MTRRKEFEDQIKELREQRERRRSDAAARSVVLDRLIQESKRSMARLRKGTEEARRSVAEIESGRDGAEGAVLPRTVRAKLDQVSEGLTQVDAAIERARRHYAQAYWIIVGVEERLERVEEALLLAEGDLVGGRDQEKESPEERPKRAARRGQTARND